MSTRLLPLNDTDFWWLRYVLGLAAPLGLAAYGTYSLLTFHSWAILLTRQYIRLVPVSGEQAILMGAAFWGFALMLYASCYAQYHEKLGFYYEWILAPGALLAGGGILWCSYIFFLG